MARDIEEFLRRAAERRKQHQQGQRQPIPAPVPKPTPRVRQIVDSTEVELIAPKATNVEPRKKRSSRTESGQQRDMRNESVAEHVKKHINTRSISESAKRLGDDIENADDRIAQRVQRKFDHDVSKLDDLPTVQDDIVATATEAETAPFARDLIEMFRSPNGVRQAILISEILKRPDLG